MENILENSFRKYVKYISETKILMIEQIYAQTGTSNSKFHFVVVEPSRQLSTTLLFAHSLQHKTHGLRYKLFTKTEKEIRSKNVIITLFLNIYMYTCIANDHHLPSNAQPFPKQRPREKFSTE